MHYLHTFISAVLFIGIFSFPFAYGIEDSEYEDHIHNIYLKYYEDPVSYSEWSSAIGAVAASSYKLKHKDTLWDLSKDMLKNSLYWSKLWVANKHIKNPHRISQGDSVNWEVKNLIAVNNSPNSVDILSQFKNIKLPELVRKPVLTDSTIPDSLAYLVQPDLLQHSVHIEFAPEKKSDSIRLLSAYLSDSKIPSVGTVVRKNGAGSFIFNGEQVILDITGDTPQSGSLYNVFVNKGALGLFNQIGYEIFIKGEVRIIHPIANSSSLYLAEVIKSTNIIQSGDLVSPGPIPRYVSPHRKRMGNQEGNIVGFSQFQNESISINSFIYLNKGREDGIYPGDIYYTKANKDQHKKAQLPYSEPTGLIQIAHASSTSSTAVVIQMKSNIYVGDVFGNYGSRDFLKNSEIIDPDPISNDELEEQELEEEEFIDKAEFELNEDVEDQEEEMEDQEDQEEEMEDQEEDLEEAMEDQEDLEDQEEETEDDEYEENLDEEIEDEDVEDEEIEDQEDLEEDIQEEFEEFEAMEEINNEDA